MDLIITRVINDDFMVLIKGFQKEPDLGVKYFHPSIDDDSEATYIDKEENISPPDQVLFSNPLMSTMKSSLITLVIIRSILSSSLQLRGFQTKQYCVLLLVGP